MRISFRKINCYAMVIMIILGATPVIRYLDDFNYPEGLISYLIILVCFTGMAAEWKYYGAKLPIRVPIVLGAYLLLYAVASRYNVASYMKSVVVFIMAFFLYCYFLQKNGGFRDFMDAYVNVMLIIGVISVVFWLFGSVLHIMPGRTSMTYTWGVHTYRTYSYYYIYFENPVQNQQLLGMSWPRNTGIFTEAPAYSGFMLYALGIEFFGREQRNWKRIVPLLVTVMTIQSTKAYLILIVLFALMYLTKSSKGRSRSYLVLRFLFTLILLAGAAFVFLFILEEKSTSSSYAARINHLVSGFKTWLDHPLFGAGFNNTHELYANREEGYGASGTSMGIAILLAYGGLYLFGLYAYSYFFALRNPAIRKNRKNYNYFALMLLMNLFVSNSAFGLPYKFMIAAAYAAGAQVLPGRERASGPQKADGAMEQLPS